MSHSHGEDDCCSEDHGSVGQSRLESYVFSCELSSKVPFYTFQGDEEEDLEHFLELRTVCLGEGAKEESNVVEVTAMNHQGKTISVPVANLHINCLPMVSLGEFELKAPVTIRLKSGTGPVTVSGLHLIASDNADSDLSSEEEDLDEEIIPIKPAKKKQKL
ncbi:nucleoplasmin-3 [Salvelinus alpinus]|uniref:Nucleoplasmin core domain-containing protein n=6 Tax=Salmoninae TaxID=504568 RepID=A0A060XE43_ONCMY|nr:nucleoplasmin-3 [Salmo salar]XP_020350501.1 nucleoplasmin-3 isoform X1 [Oncorhynchus kisutch]XP_021435808.1 nucleoplasmin-3 isoform X1 [Oncorhynchus mykiss]XP_023864362.1 nucleoplasmin-3 [Salvelinus alpinus]XP_024279387.1 nucleoplasmin-3 [Oncorhynchus tshawytscha]XP_029553801.1 nucleoplasmin-3 [Salmo trutta]XP_035656311.1 nucleoplasmin-3 isoform X1 [Oncorhynchus keta]XP_038846411.1 nucleoplasmin-3 [Salvelinus namaycush]XP_046207800.1 nucleoplasmin-3 [Oncorhynchus gorbuscha]XP_055776093.|eukprot:NP_001140011.1 Nucleoplasmin-like protein NO29 [Salmo salar]